VKCGHLFATVRKGRALAGQHFRKDVRCTSEAAIGTARGRTAEKGREETTDRGAEIRDLPHRPAPPDDEDLSPATIPGNYV